MKLVGTAGQPGPHSLYDASGSIVSGSAPQLLLPRRFSCSHLVVQNLSATVMYLEFGSARAVATISGGQVSAITVTNAGFGFSLAPTIQLRGGGNMMYPAFLGATDPNAPAAAHPATAHCVMTGTAPNMSVASIVIDNPGSGYEVAPYVMIANRHADPGGCADPSANSGSGILLAANGGIHSINGTVCTTDQAALFCASAGARFTCKWAD
jgi:hypothetical protein